MEKVLILPNRFKIIGLQATASGIVGNLISSQNGLINVYRLFGSSLNGRQPYPPNFRDINLILEYCSISMMVVGLLCFFLAKEPDEFFYKVRLDSIQWAVSAQVLTAISMQAFCYISGDYEMPNTYVATLTLSFMSFWATFILRYYYVLWVKEKTDSLS